MVGSQCPGAGCRGESSAHVAGAGSMKEAGGFFFMLKRLLGCLAHNRAMNGLILKIRGLSGCFVRNELDVGQA